jgi:hypothetical protein
MSEASPFVSVIIPMRNEAGHVAPCLERRTRESAWR